MGILERRTVGLVLTPALFLATWFAPLGLDPRAHRLAAVFAAVIVAWVTEVLPISVTALLIAPAMIVAGVTDSRGAFAPYADPLIFLFIGGFFIARAMTRHGLDRRIARSLMQFRLVRGSPVRIRMAFMMTAVVLSMWISNTATAAILIPILLGTLPEDDDANSGSVLSIAYAASVGGMGTLIGSPPNFITVRFLQEQTGTQFDFVQWMGIGLPTALVLVVIIGFVMQWLAPPQRSESSVTLVASPWSRGERVTAFCFGLAVVGWTVPGIMRAVGAPHAEAIARALPIGAVAILEAAPLFLILDEDKKVPVLPWHDAVRIDWGLILLFGGGLHRFHHLLHRSVLQHRIVEHDCAARDRSGGRVRRLPASTGVGRRPRRELRVHAPHRNGTERRRLRNRFARVAADDPHRVRAEHRNRTGSPRSVVWIEHLLRLGIALRIC